MEKNGEKSKLRETTGNILKYGGLIGGILGLVELNPFVLLFSAGSFVAGNKLKGEGALKL